MTTDHESRERERNLIWRHTHRDYRGVVNGRRTILRLREGHGTCLVFLDELTEAEHRDELVSAQRQEARRLERKQKKES